MTAYLIEWLSLLLRWLHLIAGIAWIGSSFYFIWLNNHVLKPDAALSARGVAGEAWIVHGGAFYSAHKYRGVPSPLPGTLHWVYWEAYTTFLSGFFLLSLMYYGQAEVYLIDARVMALSKSAAVALGLSFIVGGWLIYDALCRSPLARDARAIGTALVVLFTALAWSLCHLFSGRGAFIEFGAVLGTIMVANVFFVIIPGQRKLIAALQAGREPDLEDGRRGALRSTHNTYFTLPVLFTMTSNHYAITYGAKYNWLVLIALGVAGLLIRVYFVQRHTARERAGRTSPLPILAAAILIVMLLVTLAPTGLNTRAAAVRDDEFTHVQRIVAQRCATCHAAAPTQPGFVAAPKGVLLDNPEHILLQVAAMQQQLTTRAMPVGNLTEMTEDERDLLLDWIQRGAPH